MVVLTTRLRDMFPEYDKTTQIFSQQHDKNRFSVPKKLHQRRRAALNEIKKVQWHYRRGLNKNLNQKINFSFDLTYGDESCLVPVLGRTTWGTWLVDNFTVTNGCLLHFAFAACHRFFGMQVDHLFVSPSSVSRTMTVFFEMELSVLWNQTISTGMCLCQNMLS